MKKILFIVLAPLFINCNSSAQKSHDSELSILAKKYAFEFTIDRFLIDSTEIKSSEKIYGQIRRHNDFIISKSSFGLGILEDSLCLFIDDSLKIVTLDGKLTLTPRLIIPFYDPLSILNYAKRFANSHNETTSNVINKQDFKFPTDTIPAIRIIITENKKDNSYVVEFTYHSLGNKIKDIIYYKIIDDSEVKMEIPFYWRNCVWRN